MCFGKNKVSGYSPAMHRSNQKIKGKMNDDIYSYLGSIKIGITERL